jgi:hypothetical protein
MANQNVNITIKAFDKTSRAFGTATRGIKAIAGAALNLKTALIGTAGVAGMGLLVKSSLDATDTLGKTARKIGVTTEALASMRYAAELTGVATATMDMALQRFTRRAAEAAMGTGEAKGALKELRLDAAQLIKMPLDKQMQELAGAFAEVETDADKVRLAMKLFDSEGVALVNTLGLGKQALIEMAAEANRLGIALSADAVQGVEDANDAFTRLGQLFKGVRDQTVAALSPALETLATTLKEKVLTAIESTEGGVEQFAKNLAVKIIQAVGAALTALQSLVNGVIGTLNEIKGASDRFTGFFKPDEEKSIGQLRAALRALNAEQEKNNELAKTGGMNPEAAQRQIALIEEQKSKLLDLALAKQDVGDIDLIPEVNFADKINDTFAQIITGINGVGEAKTNQGEAPPTVPPLEDTRSALQKNFDALKQQGKNEIKFAEMTSDEKVKHVSGGLQKQFALAGRNSKKMFALSKAAGIADALVSTYQGAAKSMGAYPFPINVAMAAASVAAGMAQVSAIKAQSFDGGGFTGSGSRTGGVDGKGGFPAILHPNETVIDHTKGRVSSGTSDAVIVNQTINVTTGVQSTVRAEIANLMPQISEAAENAVLGARLRGGSYSKQLVGR